jgi:hypothetical protein
MGGLHQGVGDEPLLAGWNELPRGKLRGMSPHGFKLYVTYGFLRALFHGWCGSCKSRHNLMFSREGGKELWSEFVIPEKCVDRIWQETVQNGKWL